MRYPDPAQVDSAKPISGLKGALRYVRAYRNRVFVVKIGGEVAGDPEALDRAAAQVGLLHSLGVRVVLVHGGSRQASGLSRRLGHEPRIVAGRRVTDDAAREVAIMVYGGTINVEILTALRVHHVPAVGLSGIDGELVTVTRRPPVETVDDDGHRAVVDYGWVGDVTTVDPTVLETLLVARFVPVVACLAADEAGEVYNVNADTIAERIAVAMGAMKLIVLTGVAGLLRDRDDPTSIVSFADARDVEGLVASGAVAGGMRPKVEACVRAAAGGVERTHIIDGRLPDAILQEVFTGAGCGTMIVNRREKADYPDVEPEE